MDVSKKWVGCFYVFLVLPLKVFQLVCHVLLKALQIVWLQTAVWIIKLIKMQHDIQKRCLAIEVICVGRVSDFIRDAINLDLVFWNTLENHSPEHGLVESCAIDNKRLDEGKNNISVTYSSLCVQVL